MKNICDPPRVYFLTRSSLKKCNMNRFYVYLVYLFHLFLVDSLEKPFQRVSKWFTKESANIWIMISRVISKIWTSASSGGLSNPRNVAWQAVSRSSVFPLGKGLPLRWLLGTEGRTSLVCFEHPGLKNVERFTYRISKSYQALEEKDSGTLVSHSTSSVSENSSSSTALVMPYYECSESYIPKSKIP